MIVLHYIPRDLRHCTVDKRMHHRNAPQLYTIDHGAGFNRHKSKAPTFKIKALYIYLGPAIWSRHFGYKHSTVLIHLLGRLTDRMRHET